MNPEEDGGQVNLLRDLDVLSEVKEKRDRKGQRGQNRSNRGAGKPRLDLAGLNLSDPLLYKALMEECLKEEKLPMTKEYKPPPLVTNYLVRNDVRPLKKRSTKFPKAQYYCRLCDYHCDTLTICITHIIDDRHSRLARMQEVETTLFHLPKPGKQHLEYLEQLLNGLHMEQGLSKEEVRNRLTVERKITVLLNPLLPGSSVRLYGSCMTGFGLKSSSLNLDLQISESIQPHVALMTTFEFFQSNNNFSSVQRDFRAKIPKILFEAYGFQCEISLNNHHAFQTSALIRDYLSLDKRVGVLSTAIRLWAKLTSLDRQAEGTLPSHAFALMLIFYLQQLKQPLLPCIHEHLESNEVEDYNPPTEILKEWKSDNQDSCATLLIGFFKYYSLDFRQSDLVVCLRFKNGLTKTDKQWKGKKLAIEDPFSPKRNLIRSVNSLSILDYILDCFKIAFLYFGTIQTTKGPIITKILVPDESPERKSSSPNQSEEDSNLEEENESSSVEDLLNKLQIPSTTTNVTGPIPTSAIKMEELEQSFVDEKPKCPSPCNEEVENGETFESFLKKYGRELTPKQAKIATSLVPKNMIQFLFDGDILTAGRKPELICTVCGNSGHLQSDCPEEQLPHLAPLPPLPQEYENILNELCHRVVLNCEPSKEEIDDRKSFIKELSKYIKHSHPTAQLTVFGSSHNGFAFANSDLDISLTFDDHKTDINLDSIEIIETLAERLKNMGRMKNVQAITSAKVPIIKFMRSKYASSSQRSKIEGDISLYNILAQRNTHMLRLYSMIDNRTRILGYMVKLFAKTCDIGDASRGSLSSYAYILMVIHYLQQVQPPVIPVLQELHPKGEKPEVIVDGWNSWFFDDIENLANVWPGCGKNTMSPAALWIDFLDYYSRQFDDKNLVICARQHKLLTKFEKMWNSPCIAIEDPFDLSHNLGAGISRKMNIFIKRSFMKARDHFGFPPRMIPDRYKTIDEFFWDKAFLTEGAPPNDRGCRACGKIGHIARECPKRKIIEDKKKDHKLQKQRSSNPQAQKQKQLVQKQRQQQPPQQPIFRNTKSAKTSTNSSDKVQVGSSLPMSSNKSEVNITTGENNPILKLLSQAKADPQLTTPLSPSPQAAMLLSDLQSNIGGKPPPLPSSAIALSDLEDSLISSKTLPNAEKNLKDIPGPVMTSGFGGFAGMHSQVPPFASNALPAHHAQRATRPLTGPTPTPSLDFLNSNFARMPGLPSELGPSLLTMPPPFGSLSSPNLLVPPMVNPSSTSEERAKPLQLNDLPHLNLLSQLRPPMPQSDSNMPRINDNTLRNIPPTFSSQTNPFQDPFQRHWQP